MDAGSSSSSSLSAFSATSAAAHEKAILPLPLPVALMQPAGLAVGQPVTAAAHHWPPAPVPRRRVAPPAGCAARLSGTPLRFATGQATGRDRLTVRSPDQARAWSNRSPCPVAP